METMISHNFLVACTEDITNIKKLKKYLKEGADVNVKDCIGSTPLHYACEGGHKEVVNFLISQGARVDEKNSEGMIPLMDACLNGHPEVALILLECGADINSMGDNDVSVLAYAVVGNNFAAVKLVLEHPDLQPDIINKQNYNDGYTPLLLAIENKDEKIINLLLSYKPDVNIQDYNHKSPLYFAIENELYDSALKLIEHGADVNAEHDNETLLALFTRHYNINAVRFLMKTDIEVNKADINDYCPIHWAAKGNLPELVRLLIQKGADVNLKIDDCETPVYFAVREYIHCVRSVLKIERSIQQIETCEHCRSRIASEERKNISESLQEKLIVNKNKLSNMFEIIKLLLSHGADYESCNYGMLTMIFKMENSGAKSKLIKLLKEHSDKHYIEYYDEFVSKLNCKNRVYDHKYDITICLASPDAYCDCDGLISVDECDGFDYEE